MIGEETHRIYCVTRPLFWRLVGRLGMWLIETAQKRNVYTEVTR